MNAYISKHDFKLVNEGFITQNDTDETTYTIVFDKKSGCDKGRFTL